MLFDRQRFARQSSLRDEEVLGVQDAAIGGNHVARGEQHHVTRHQLRQRHFQLMRAGLVQGRAVGAVAGAVPG
ncbi:hypothetical protein G6F35_019157 [Rhizopus arrhizus]|nr:hypothetical protein G6F35_019157 [Rhizopus arrhizus]